VDDRKEEETMKAQKPRPCGCGGVAVIWPTGDHYYEVGCTRCGIHIPVRLKSKAIRRWNIAMGGKA
jgi:hypothetical protein